ncbi:MAG: hypothetical protein HY543_10890 [Deltaproteobacteria bacterium]|nr:hypothetical protein [Deltaproteobacteria bacterium]
MIPTIYLRNHRVANPAPESRFHLTEDPLVLAEEFEQAGVTMLYVVDLDAPQTTGTVTHADILQALCRNGRFTVHISGPIRTIEAIDRYVRLGVSRVVLGAIAYQKPPFTMEAGKRFPGHLAAEIHVRNQKVVIPGWTAAAHRSAVEYATQFREAGVDCLMYSDVNEVGQLTAENLRNIRAFASTAGLPIIHATDIGTIEDLEHLLLLEKFGVIGTLFSKSLYEGRFDIKGLILLASERGLPSEDSTLISDSE